jgi:hypothetical protein
MIDNILEARYRACRARAFGREEGPLSLYLSCCQVPSVAWFVGVKDELIRAYSWVAAEGHGCSTFKLNEVKEAWEVKEMAMVGGGCC